MNPKVLLLVEIPALLLGIAFIVGITVDRGIVGLLTVVLVAVAAFGFGFAILLWLYRLAQRRVDNDIEPKRWEYWLQAHGYWFLPPAILVGMWASKFGSDTSWGDASTVAATFVLAGFLHACVVVRPPALTKSV